jgi:hypothetical protein
VPFGTSVASCRSPLVNGGRNLWRVALVTWNVGCLLAEGCVASHHGHLRGERACGLPASDQQAVDRSSMDGGPNGRGPTGRVAGRR